jgi:hypothetical protein
LLNQALITSATKIASSWRVRRWSAPSREMKLFECEAASKIGCVANFLFQSFRYSVGATVGEEAVFKGRQFDRSVILLCVRWYLAYNLSLRNLEEMMAEWGISVDHATIHRWVIRYSPELLERFNSRKRVVTGKWHLDGVSRTHF